MKYKRNQRRHRGRGRHQRRRHQKPALNPKLFISNKQDHEQQQQKPDYTGVSFSKFDLSSQLLKNLSAKGFDVTTPIQEQVIPTVMSGKNVLAISQTGSGKTGAFLIPVIDKIISQPQHRALIIAPTRELASQIHKEAISLARGTKVFSTLIIGGNNIGKQIKQLRRQPQIVVGTPGRLKDLHQRNNLKFSNFNLLVVDEVDRMMDMGFVSEVRLINKLTAQNKQSLYFSATTDKRIAKIAQELCNDYVAFELETNKPTTSVSQDIVKFHDNGDKIDMLTEILIGDEVNKTLVFVETKRYADKVHKQLSQNGHRSGTIHGNKRQNQRRKTLEQFRTSKINVLVATNVAARGIDIDDISHVINLDAPTSYDEYIHRIGRTGRNGRTGTAFTFVRHK